jgi:citrate synthase
LPILTAETLKWNSVITGLLTIGPRFGGAIDDAARYFKDACDRVSQLRFSFRFKHLHVS